MAYPGDSAIDAQPVGDQSGQGSPYAALYDQAYANPGAGTGTDSAAFGNQSFAPDSSMAGLLPQYEELPTDNAAMQPGAALPADYATMQPGAALPADYAAMQPGAALPADASAAQLGSNPWDTYVMDPAAIAGEPDTTQAESVSPEGSLPEAGLPAASSPEEQVAQLQQHLESAINEVVQLGTSGQMTGTEEDMKKFSAAVTEVVATAELLGQVTGTGGAEQPGAMPADGSAIAPGAMPADGSAMAPGAMPADGSAIAPGAMPTDGSAMEPEPMAGNAAGEQLQVNPYEPQVPPTSTDGMDPQMAMAPTGNPEVEDLKAKLGSEVSNLVSLITPASADPASPAGSSTNAGNADNFKMALKNIVQTAQELGAKEQSAQVTQPASVG